MKKNVIAIVANSAAIVILICLLGIFGNFKEAYEGAEKFTGVLEENVTIRILENDTAIQQGYLKELLAAFNKEYEQYGITAVDANMDQFTDLENDGPFGFGPDVLYQANDMLMKYVDGKHIQPLPVQELDCYDQISKQAWSAYTAQIGADTLYFGVPVNIQSPILYYRKDLLPTDWKVRYDKNNNDIPDMVENWNDMYKFSLERKQLGKDKYGYMESLFDPYFACGYLFSYGAYVFGDNNTDATDIGFSNGDAEKGGWIMKQQASSMNEWCIDDTIKLNAYSRIGNGDYFATMTTPDVYTLFIDEMMLAGMTRKQATENLVTTYIPMLPKSGDLTESNPELIPCNMMGGVNGYAMSSYTNAPNASLAFIDFATKYEMIARRNELLGIVPARADAADAAGGLSKIIYDNLDSGNVSIMPSIRATGQIWTPVQTFFTDIATDAFRKPSEMKYNSLADIKKALQNVDKQVYDAIHTLQ